MADMDSPKTNSLFHSRRRYLAKGMGLAVLTLLSACGSWRLRGLDLGLSFKTMAIVGAGGTADEIRQLVFGQPGIKIVQNPIDAQVVLYILSQNIDRTVVSFSSAGRPREIQLRMRVGYRVTDGYAVELSPPQEVEQNRDLSVSESEILAMTSAESFMQDDMQRDIAQQIIRRLRTVKPARS